MENPTEKDANWLNGERCFYKRFFVDDCQKCFYYQECSAMQYQEIADVLAR